MLTDKDILTGKSHRSSLSVGPMKVTLITPLVAQNPSRGAQIVASDT